MRHRQHQFQSTPTRGRRKKRDTEEAKDEGIGVSRGGRNTKVHAVVDALGNPVRLFFTGGNINDCTVAEDVLSPVDINGSVVMGDKAYGTKAIRDYITSRGASYVIPPKANATEPWECDWWQYKERHLVECFFNKLKQFRRVATRYDKSLEHFKSFTLLASIIILLK